MGQGLPLPGTQAGCSVRTMQGGDWVVAEREDRVGRGKGSEEVV